MSPTTTHSRKEPDTAHANRLTVREWRPASGARGAFLLLHGMESHSAWWGEIASRLVGKGWAVVAFDRSGWGTSGGMRGHLASYRNFVEEACGLATNLRQKYGAVHLAGMSWGGMATLYLGLRRGWLFDSLTMLAPGIASKIDLPIAGKYRMLMDFLRKNHSSLVSPVFHPEHFTANPEKRDFIQNDPDRIHQVTTSFCIETLKMRQFCKQMAGKRVLPPSLCLLAGDDSIINNKSTRELCQRAGVAVEEIPHAAHTLIFERPELVTERMAALAEQAARPQAEPATVWVVGAGAVGGGVGTLMAFGKQRVGMLVKEKYEPLLKRDGLTLRAGHAMRTTTPAMTIAASVDALPKRPDLVVIAVKSFDTDATLASLAGKIPPNAVIATLQNGIGNEAKIAAAFPDHTIIAGSICASLELLEPGCIGWPDERGGLGAAVYKGDGEKAKKVWLALTSPTGMETRWYDGPKAAERLKWTKLMLNIGFNALNSLTGMSSAALLADQTYGRLAVRALREGFAEMKARQVEPVDLPGFSVSKLELVIRAPVDIARKLMSFEAARSTEASFSMRQDMLNKRQHTEIQELNGVIVRSAHERGVHAPANEKLLEMVEEKSKNSQRIN